METTASTWINPSVLSWARKRLGLSEKDVENLSKSLGKFYAPVTKKGFALQQKSGDSGRTRKQVFLGGGETSRHKASFASR